MHTRTRIVITGLLSALALLAGACNGDLAESGGDAVPEGGSYNDADLSFLQGMIPHHEQAVEMAQLVPDRTDRTELNELADSIIASQEAEIVVMEQFLDEAGVSGEGGHEDHGEDGMAAMPGMMTEEDMDNLATLEDLEFDLAFLDMMIEHHEGAITSAGQVIDEGEHPQVLQLARDIIAEQQAEIDQMSTWHEEWSTEAS